MLNGDSSTAVLYQQRSVDGYPEPLPPDAEPRQLLETYRAGKLPPKPELPKPKPAASSAH